MTIVRKTSAQMHGGMLFDLANPTVDRIRPLDIISQMAYINRYNGATEGRPLSLLAHSLLVCDLCEDPAAKPYALLHDAHEAYLGDITQPQIALYEEKLPGFELMLKRLKADYDKLIFEAFNLPLGIRFTIKRDVAEADARALQLEVRDLLAEPEQAWCNPVVGSPEQSALDYCDLTPEKAKLTFILRCAEVWIAQGFCPPAFTSSYFREIAVDALG
jgi:hypothetical protein